MNNEAVQIQPMDIPGIAFNSGVPAENGNKKSKKKAGRKKIQNN